MKKDDNSYKVGMYIRLSREDGDDLESESISNQRSLITGYLRANGIEPVDEYIDDGFSGGNFNRPGFKRLILDIEQKKINMVITKDLSRLGRDYIDTGHYVERYFPENNIRYVAINDDIDTFYETSSSEMMPFKLGLNDMYAKDISKKVKSSLTSKKQSGEYCGSIAPYGYIKSPKDKHILIPDPETKEVVKKIFELYISGYTSSDIAHTLTISNIKTPVLRDSLSGRKYKLDHPEIWKHSTVNNILKNRVYTGCTVQHTTTSINYKTKKRKKVPEEEWIINENAHEALISKETFKLAQTIRNKHNNYSSDRRNVEYLFSGMVYCKDCGSLMSISYDKKRERTSMNCNSYRKLSKYDICFSHFINYDKLQDTIFAKLREKCLTYKGNLELEKLLMSDSNNNPIKELEDKLRQTNYKIKRLEEKLISLYDDKFNDVITEVMYKKLVENVEKEINVLKKNIKTLEQEKKKSQFEQIEKIDYAKVVDDYLNMQNPTKEIINRIINKIYINKNKEIEIYYNIKNFEKVNS